MKAEQLYSIIADVPAESNVMLLSPFNGDPEQVAAVRVERRYVGDTMTTTVVLVSEEEVA